MGIFETLYHAIVANQLFASGIVLALVGGTVAMLRNVPKQILMALKSLVTVHLEVRDEQALAALAELLSTQRYGERCRRISVAIDRDGANATAGRAPLLIFGPGRGNHVFPHNGKLFWLERALDDKAGGDLTKIVAREFISVRTWGRNPAPVRELIQAAMQYVQERKVGRCVTYINEGYGRWVECARKEGRSLDSIVLRAGLAEEIIGAIEQFRDSREWYREMGIPHRLNFGFYGPPGNGKSTIIGAAAAHFNAPLYILNPSNPRMDDDDLLKMIRQTLPGAFVLFEDVDKLFVQREATEAVSNRVTFSGFLNAIDGVASPEGCNMFFTTNHPENIDPGLLRPGRIDMLREIGNCDHDQLRRFYLRFSPGELELATIFADAYTERNLPACEVQQLLMKHRNDPAGMLCEVEMENGVAI